MIPSLTGKARGMDARVKRRVRDPAATRETILEAAANLLAKDGPEGVSLSAVAHLAAVNRGTAYQHFETREKLIEARSSGFPTSCSTPSSARATSTTRARSAIPT